MSIDAFKPASGAATQLIAATTVPSAAITLGQSCYGARFQPSAACMFAFGSSAGSSGIVATLPTTSTPGNGIPLVAGSAEVFNIGPKAYISFICASGTANVYATPGDGV